MEGTGEASASEILPRKVFKKKGKESSFSISPRLPSEVTPGIGQQLFAVNTNHFRFFQARWCWPPSFLRADPTACPLSLPLTCRAAREVREEGPKPARKQRESCCFGSFVCLPRQGPWEGNDGLQGGRTWPCLCHRLPGPSSCLQP